MNNEAAASAFTDTGETDMTNLSPEVREAVIRERFKDEPWIITFADWQGWTYVSDLDDIEREATDSYQGEWNDLEDYAQNLVEDAYSEVLNNLPDFIAYAIDYERIGREMEMGGDVYTEASPNSYGIYVFNTQW